MKKENYRYKIFIDGEWYVEDFTNFLNTYLQVYYFFNSLFDKEFKIDNERIDFAYSSFPWQGGYSAINFYWQLKYAVSKKQRPKIVAMHFSSPGFIELSLFPHIADIIAETILPIAGSIIAANKTYHKIYSGMQKRDILSIKKKQEETKLLIDKKILDNLELDNKLKKEDLEFIKKSNEKLARILKLDSTVLDQINHKTEHPYKTLKILLSLYRRIKTLAENERNRKLKL